MSFCAKCGAQLAEGVTFCGACGAPVEVAAAPAAATPGAGVPVATASAGSGLAPNMAGALAYVTIIPAILFLVMEPYNKDRFIRFHSFQCLFFAGSMFVLSILLMIVGFVVAFVPVLGWLLDLLLWLVFSFGSLGLVIFLIYKAYNGEKFMVPVIGKLADQQASK
ncbi:MAG: zinc-ribbon domain-containing protein [Terriglobia bacterium]